MRVNEGTMVLVTYSDWCMLIGRLPSLKISNDLDVSQPQKLGPFIWRVRRLDNKNIKFDLDSSCSSPKFYAGT